MQLFRLTFHEFYDAEVTPPGWKIFMANIQILRANANLKQNEQVPVCEWIVSNMSRHVSLFLFHDFNDNACPSLHFWHLLTIVFVLSSPQISSHPQAHAFIHRRERPQCTPRHLLELASSPRMCQKLTYHYHLSTSLASAFYLCCLGIRLRNSAPTCIL